MLTVIRKVKYDKDPHPLSFMSENKTFPFSLHLSKQPPPRRKKQKRCLRVDRRSLGKRGNSPLESKGGEERRDRERERGERKGGNAFWLLIRDRRRSLLGHLRMKDRFWYRLEKWQLY